MSFFKKFTRKSNKIQVKEVATQTEEFIFEEVQNFEEIQNNFEENNWDHISIPNNDIPWDLEEEVDQSWSTSSQKDFSSQPKVEQDNQNLVQESSSSSQITLTEDKNSVNNFKYLLELILFVLILVTPLIFRLFFGMLLFYRAYLIFPKLLLAEGDYVKMMNPLCICFSQSYINKYFQDRPDDIEDTINNFINGSLRVEDIPIIQVCIINDIFYSSDNRRLYCFQQAIKRGLKIKRIPVKVRRVSDLNIDWKLKGSYKIVRNNNFKDIIVSQYAKNGRVISDDGYFDFFKF